MRSSASMSSRKRASSSGSPDPLWAGDSGSLWVTYAMRTSYDTKFSLSILFLCQFLRPFGCRGCGASLAAPVGDAVRVDLLTGLLDHAATGSALDIVIAAEASSASELLERADRLAERLTRGVPVAVRASATLDTVIAVVAALRAGAPLVPIADDSGVGERGHIIRDSGARAVLGEHGWPDVDLPVIAERSGAVSPVDGIAPLDASLIVYTSGTTGPPKGVLLPESSIAACIDGLRDAWGWTPDDRLVHGL